MAETEKSKKQIIGLSTHVRFSKDEYERLLREREITGKSIPFLLKESHFKRKEISPLMHPLDQKAVSRNVSLILEELHQLRARTPANGSENLSSVLREMTERLQTLFLFVTGNNGNR